MQWEIGLVLWDDSHIIGPFNNLDDAYKEADKRNVKGEYTNKMGEPHWTIARYNHIKRRENCIIEAPKEK